MERSASKRVLVKIFTPVEVGSVSASELDGLLDQIHKVIGVILCCYLATLR